MKHVVILVEVRKRNTENVDSKVLKGKNSSTMLS